jgi:hypothetical protein
LRRKSYLYINSIDSSKAFDKVWRPGFFCKLIGQILQEEWRILWLYYSNSLILIQLNQVCSQTFKISGGVKEGGPLSPKLNNINIAELIDIINKPEKGEIINKMRLNILVYADDIILVSPLRRDLIDMLDATIDYMELWKIKIDIEKTNYMICGEPCTVKRNIQIKDIELEEVKQMKNLGIIFKTHI